MGCSFLFSLKGKGARLVLAFRFLSSAFFKWQVIVDCSSTVCSLSYWSSHGCLSCLTSCFTAALVSYSLNWNPQPPCAFCTAPSAPFVPPVFSICWFEVGLLLFCKMSSIFAKWSGIDAYNYSYTLWQIGCSNHIDTSMHNHASCDKYDFNLATL